MRLHVARVVGLYVPVALVFAAAAAGAWIWRSGTEALAREEATARAQAERVLNLVLGVGLRGVAADVAELSGSPALLAAVEQDDRAAVREIIGAAVLRTADPLELVAVSRAGQPWVQVSVSQAEAATLASALAGHFDSPGGWRAVEVDGRRVLAVAEPIVGPDTGRVLGYVRGALFVDGRALGLADALRQAVGGRSIELGEAAGAAPGEHAFALPLPIEGETLRAVVRLPDDAARALRGSFVRSTLALLAMGLLLVLGLVWTLRRAVLPSVQGLVDFADRARAGERDARFVPGPAVELNQVGETLAAAVDAVHAQRRLAEELHRAFEGLVYAAAHDLRAPLVTIGGLGEAVADAAAAGDLGEVGEDARAVVRAADRMGNMLHGLERLARVGMRRTAEAVDLAELVRAAAEARVALTVEGEVPPVRGDRENLGAVAWALVDNVARHGGGTARLSAARDDGTVTVRLEDDGPGIGEDERQKVFAPFYRGNRQGEVGLGLTIVRRVVELAGGTVEVDVGARGGCAVVMRLPAA